MALLDGAADNEQAEEDEQRAEQADYFVGAFAWDVLRTHNHALTPDMKSHHDVGPHHIEPPEYEQNKPHDVLFHPPILHPRIRLGCCFHFRGV